MIIGNKLMTNWLKHRGAWEPLYNRMFTPLECRGATWPHMTSIFNHLLFIYLLALTLTKFINTVEWRFCLIFQYLLPIFNFVIPPILIRIKVRDTSPYFQVKKFILLVCKKFYLSWTVPNQPLPNEFLVSNLVDLFYLNAQAHVQHFKFIIAYGLRKWSKFRFSR